MLHIPCWCPRCWWQTENLHRSLELTTYKPSLCVNLYKICKCTSEMWIFNHFSGLIIRGKKSNLLPIILPAVFALTAFCGAMKCTRACEVTELGYVLWVCSVWRRKACLLSILIFLSEFKCVLCPSALCPAETWPSVSNPVFSLSLSHLCFLPTWFSFSAPLQSLCSTLVWNTERHFKALSVSWDQLCLYQKHRRWS